VVRSQAPHLHHPLASVIQIDRETPSGMAGRKPGPVVAALDSTICAPVSHGDTAPEVVTDSVMTVGENAH
jgi:hypothetical protein